MPATKGWSSLQEQASTNCNQLTQGACRSWATGATLVTYPPSDQSVTGEGLIADPRAGGGGYPTPQLLLAGGAPAFLPTCPPLPRPLPKRQARLLRQCTHAPVHPLHVATAAGDARAVGVIGLVEGQA